MLGEVVRTGKYCFTASRRLRAALLTSSALALAWALTATPSRGSSDGTWLASPGSNDYGTRTDWDGGAVPTGTASFGTSNTTSLVIASASIGGWTFNAGASLAGMVEGEFSRSTQTYTGKGTVPHEW